ncbi:MAG: 50S ribosomal protein L9 [Candidatus Omnitrophica bacterium]|nr:50S ribosomal protein L9 [Candidatus Omnitrophota bacterium]MDD5429851.1 50S ribosomal protein L9 [Candidatus Omnitrophota bacterium]
MKVILLKTLKKFGKEGTIAEVKDGYARNYLMPRGIAMAASEKNFKKLEEIKVKKTKAAEKEKGVFEDLKDKLEKLSLTIVAEANENEDLYGAIGEAQIIKALKAEKVELDKNTIVLEEPIKKLGVYNLKIALHPEIKAGLRVWVVKK